MLFLEKTRSNFLQRLHLKVLKTKFGANFFKRVLTSFENLLVSENQQAHLIKQSIENILGLPAMRQAETYVDKNYKNQN